MKEDFSDQQKTICTPFKKTGYCPYGDACKYSHIRSSFSSQKLYYDLDDDFCSACKKKIVNKVTTSCAHEYCETCAKDFFQKNTRCIVCEKDTKGKYWYV